MKNKALIGKEILIIANKIESYMNDILNPYGLEIEQLTFLDIISRNDGISIKKLVKIFKLDKATVTKKIKKLIALGFLDKRVNLEDKRSFNLYFTEKAHYIYPKIKKITDKGENLLNTEFSVDEKELFLTSLNKIHKKIKAQI